MVNHNGRHVKTFEELSRSPEVPVDSAMVGLYNVEPGHETFATRPPDKELHLIVDNYATHKHPKVQRWLARHPRFQVHFTPTSNSWLNKVKRARRTLDIGILLDADH